MAASPLRFAAVWLAEYAGQEVAVKVNLPAGAGGTMAVVPQEVTQMFLREAEVTGSLAHRWGTGAGVREGLPHDTCAASRAQKHTEIAA